MSFKYPTYADSVVDIGLIENIGLFDKHKMFSNSREDILEKKNNMYSFSSAYNYAAVKGY